MFGRERGGRVCMSGGNKEKDGFYGFFGGLSVGWEEGRGRIGLKDLFYEVFLVYF